MNKYIVTHEENRMKDEGNIKKARDNFIFRRTNNLYFLLKNRYDWIDKIIKEGDSVLEVGCGTGVSKFFIKTKCKLILSDLANYEWLDKKNIDALDTKLKDNSFDIVFCSNMIHHTPFPNKFFKEISRILKPNGLLLIQGINSSLITRLALRIKRHEGWNYNVNVYDDEIPCTNEKDLWSANCCIPNLLFDNIKQFEENIPEFTHEKNSYSEFITFLISGGVIAKSKTIDLPFYILKIVKIFESVPVKLFPKIFAMQRKIILLNNKKNKNDE